MRKKSITTIHDIKFALSIIFLKVSNDVNFSFLRKCRHSSDFCAGVRWESLISGQTFALSVIKVGDRQNQRWRQRRWLGTGTFRNNRLLHKITYNMHSTVMCHSSCDKLHSNFLWNSLFRGCNVTFKKVHKTRDGSRGDYLTTNYQTKLGQSNSGKSNSMLRSLSTICSLSMGNHLPSICLNMCSLSYEDVKISLSYRVLLKCSPISRRRPNFSLMGVYFFIYGTFCEMVFRGRFK